MEEILTETVAAGTADGGKGKRRKFGANERRSLYGFITAAIPLVGYLVFNIVPLGVAIVTMFVDMDGFDFGSMQWNNFANFSAVLALHRGQLYLYRAPPHRAFALSAFKRAARAEAPCA